MLDLKQKMTNLSNFKAQSLVVHWLEGRIPMSARTTISFLPLILILLFSRISSAGEMLGILSMKLDGSHVTKLVSDSQLHFASPDISPDGKRVVFD